jgi:DNA-binding transcriptional ArsR family regulator
VRRRHCATPTLFELRNAQTSMRVMQTLFRSDTQERLLALVYLAPLCAGGCTVRQLATSLGVADSTVSREVTRLVSGGAVTERRAGNQRIVARAPDSQLSRHLEGLLRATVGPEVVLRGLVAGRDDLDQALIFGSYAARAAGVPGSPPGDIDVLLVGDIPFDDAYEFAEEASSRLGLEVNPVVRSSAEWAADDSGFAAELRSGPMIDLLDRVQP